MKFLKYISHIFIIVLLTLITQVGGLIWIAVFGFFKYRSLEWNGWKRLSAFVIIYILSISTIIPITAQLGNRKMLPVFHETVQPHNIGYVLLCRNYVRTDLYEVIEELGVGQSKSIEGLKLIYLDAGFPFIDGFPLLPHLSHNDGRKIDVAFVYRDQRDNSKHNCNPSLIGYGIFEEPNQNEINQTQICKESGYWQYNYANTIGVNINESLTINESRSKFLVEKIQSNKKVQKVFIEPHLISRWNIKNIQSKLRFHGCHAVRHDDHIHFQIKP